MVLSPLDLLVLHSLRLKGFAQVPVLFDHIERSTAGWVDGPSLAAVESQLGLASEDGLARFRAGSRSGWSLTTEGRKENERLLAVELDESGLRADVEACYRDFLSLNGPMLEICTRWQVKDPDGQILNDHGDTAYDAAVVADLGQIDARIEPLCAALGDRFDRFGHYRERFSHALDRIGLGDTDWFTKPTIDSYHTVWFELHEDLLATLGIDRASERA